MEKKSHKGVVIGIVAVLVFLLLFVPLVFIGGVFATMVAFLNPTAVGMESDDVHWQALQSVSAQYNPENSIDVYLIKVVDMFHHDKSMEDKGEIEQFIITYFLLELEREVEVTETKDGVEVTRTEIEIYYLYKSFYELVSTVRGAPFYFRDEQISAIVNLSMAGVLLGGGPETGGEINGGALNGRYPAPIDGVITCGYGGRINPISGKEEFHPALDIQGKWHASVKSLADGVVDSVNTDRSPYGNYVIVKYAPEGEEPFWVKYAHLSTVGVTPGSTIKQGASVGLEGGDPVFDPNPGWTTGHHLHLEIWTKDGHVNPANYIY